MSKGSLERMTQISIQDAALALMQMPGIGSTLYARLVKRFGSPVEVWNGSASALGAVKGLSGKIISGILSGPDLKKLARLRGELQLIDAWVLTIHDPEYPSALQDISRPPPVLFGLGDKRVLCREAIAIVGSRKASSYGKRAAERFARGLCEQGYSVVSGFALGIDSAAHRGALAGGGPTVAVKGCGLDVDYPVKNRSLSGEIARNGVVLSEFFPGTHPEPGNFPARNRIISGLSRAVLVVEAGPGSGSLITAYMGLEQGKDVMAVPGSIFSYNSRGCHHLIREGAALVTSVREVIEELGEDFSEKGLAQSQDEVKVSSLSQEEQSVIDKLEPGPQHIDEIAARCGMPAALINSVLLRLELKGLVLNHSGGKYSKL